jgi:hypothetical protein
LGLIEAENLGLKESTEIGDKKIPRKLGLSKA